MEVNKCAIKDGGETLQNTIEAPSKVEVSKLEVKKKRRRGKSKRKVMKPYVKVPWQDKRRYDKSKRNNRFRKIVLAKTQAPFNNNQFLMEIHKPEPENNFQILQTPSARTRDSSFSVDSEDNYFFSLPEDEEEYLTKEFSSVYEDAQCERLSNMTKDDLIQEYLLLEAKYENLVKRTERVKPNRNNDEDKEDSLIKEVSESIDKDGDEESMVTDKDTSGTSIESSATYNPSYIDMIQRLKEQDEQLLLLQSENEKLKIENESLRKKSQESSEDSESDSSSTSISCSSSGGSRSPSPAPVQVNGEHLMNGHVEIDSHIDGENNATVNGFHNNQ